MSTIAQQLLTHEKLLKLRYYQPDTGDFYIVDAAGKPIKKCMLTKSIAGYTMISLRIDGRKIGVHAHRLAFFYVMKRWPKKDHVIDHINGDPADNSWVNLQEITYSANSSKRHTGNTMNIKSERDIYKKLYEEQLAKQGGPWLLFDCVG